MRRYRIAFILAVFLLLHCVYSTIRAADDVRSIALRPELVVQNGHSGDIASIAFSPDGCILASGSWDNTIKLWDVRKGLLIRTLEGHYNCVQRVVFSSDGKRLASASADTSIMLWDVASGVPIKRFWGHSDEAWTVAISPDGKRLASGGMDNKIILWDVKSGKPIRTMQGETEMAQALAFSSDGKMLAAGNRDYTVKLWDAETGKLIRRLGEHEDQVASVAFSADGRFLASGGMDAVIKIWDTATGELRRKIKGHGYTWSSLAFSADGKQLASCSFDAPLIIWDVATGELVRKPEIPQPDRLTGVFFSPDWKIVALVDSSNTAHIISLWNTEMGTQMGVLKGLSGSLEFVAFTSDAKNMVAATYDDFRVWDLDTGELSRHFSDFLFRDDTFALTPDGRTLVAAGSDIDLFDRDTGTQTQSIRDESFWVHALAYSPDKKLLATGCNDGAIALRDAKTGNLRQTIKAHSDTVSALAFSPDGKKIVSGSWDDTLHLWDARTGAPLKTLKGHTDDVDSVAFNPSGEMIASGGRDGTVRLWDVNTGAPIRILKGHFGEVNMVQFSPDGKVLASASWDWMICLWDVQTGKCLHRLKGHLARVRSIAFTLDGTLLVSAGFDTMLKFWDVKTGALKATALTLNDGNWIVFTPDGYFDCSPGGAKHIVWRAGIELYTGDRFFRDFYRPRLLKMIVENIPFDRTRDIKTGFNKPPALQIITPSPGDRIAAPRIKAVVVATDLGGGIRDVRLRLNGKQIPGPKVIKGQPSTRTGDSITFEFHVDLEQGANELTPEAFSADNIKTDEAPMEIICTAEGATHPDLYVVAVGINNYKNPKYNLDFARPDADGIIELFGNPARTKSLFRQVYSISLPNEKATRVGILSALDDLRSKIKVNDTVVIYFAGHGVTTERRFFFIPYESAPTKASAQTGLSMEHLGGALTAIRAYRVLVLIDACQSGGALRSRALVNQDSDRRYAIDRMGREFGFYVLAAASDQQPAQELSNLGHGLFTYAVLRGLNEKAASDASRFTTTGQLIAYVLRQVPALAKEIFKNKVLSQEPVFHGTGKDFPLISK